MTAKEKANELIEKFLYSFINEEIREVAPDGQAIYYSSAKEWRSDFDENNNPESTDEYINAKVCALICAEEILKLLGTQYAKTTDAEGTIMWKYWQEVKSEIKNS